MLGSTGVVPHRLRWSRQLRRVTHSVVVVAGALCVALIVAVAVFAGSIAPQDPDEQNFDLIEARPGAKALFGTDRLPERLYADRAYHSGDHNHRVHLWQLVLFPCPPQRLTGRV